MSISGMNFFASNNASGNLNQKKGHEEPASDLSEERSINLSPSENSSSLKDLDFTIIYDTIRCKNLQRQLDSRLRSLKFSVNQ